jgi:hypothetical protein
MTDIAWVESFVIAYSSRVEVLLPTVKLKTRKFGQLEVLETKCQAI